MKEISQYKLKIEKSDNSNSWVINETQPDGKIYNYEPCVMLESFETEEIIYEERFGSFGLKPDEYAGQVIEGKLLSLIHI